MPGSILILTGAGISAESGVPTFRDANGLWEGHRFEDVATPEAFLRQPELVHRFYNMRRAALDTVQPNAAHLAIARLQREYPGDVAVVTQNVDDLHERAGSANVFHMHGSLRRGKCTNCEADFDWQGDMETTTACPACGKSGGVRPDIVWFGEIPYFMDEIEATLCEADVFAAIGTSGLVYPAAGFVMIARLAGAETIEINNAGTGVSDHFAKHLTGPATLRVSEWVDALLENARSL